MNENTEKTNADAQASTGEGTNPQNAEFLKEREKQRIKISRNFSQRHIYSSILNDFYGTEDGRAAMMAHLPSAVPLATCLEKVMKNAIPPWKQAMEKIQLNWENIVGADNVRKVIPAYIEKKTLFLELRHPMFRAAFDNSAVKETLIRQINNIAGADTCNAIQFCARGQIKRPE